MKKETDPRLIPFRDFCFDTFREELHVTMILDATDIAQLKSMLAKTQKLPEYDLEHLKAYWLTFLGSRKAFDRQQGKPLRYFCSNVTRFAATVMASSKTPRSENVSAARAYVERRIKR